MQKCSDFTMHEILLSRWIVYCMCFVCIMNSAKWTLFSVLNKISAETTTRNIE